MVKVLALLLTLLFSATAAADTWLTARPSRIRAGQSVYLAGGSNEPTASYATLNGGMGLDDGRGYLNFRVRFCPGRTSVYTLRAYDKAGVQVGEATVTVVVR